MGIENAAGKGDQGDKKEIGKGQPQHLHGQIKLTPFGDETRRK